MEETNPKPEQALQDIRLLMDRSSRFISLSGLSGVAAGICALAGAWVARDILDGYSGSLEGRGFFSGDDFSSLKIKLISLGAVVMAAAFISSFYFTWRRAKKHGVPIWGHTSKRLFWNLVIPLGAGAGFILGMLWYGEWRFLAPASLVFYGLALINAGKYTLTDIRYLGYAEVILGLINMFFIGYGLYCWAAGFGVMHILYGAIMWYRYERDGQ